MILVQITDSHIEAAGVLTYGTFDAAASLAKIVEAINARDPQPDLVIHTGDLVHHGAPEQYGPAREILDRLKTPYVVVPGNHDAHEGFRACFGDCAWMPSGGTFVQYTVDNLPVRLVCMDTVVPGVPYGTLCEERLGWLAEQLAAEPEKPTIVAFHHPPLATGMTGSTKVGLDAGGAALAALLADNAQVQRVICGHAHRPINGLFGGRAVWVAPATCYQFDAGMSTERILALTYEPPGYSMHVWLDDPVTGGNLVTHFVPVGDFGEPIELMRNGERVGPLLSAKH